MSGFSNAVSSFTLDATNDIIGLDDLRYTTAVVVPGVPEPATWAMMIGGVGMAGGALRRRKACVSVRYT